MNLNDIFQNVRGPKGLFTVREERVKREGSPFYTWTVPVTATTATAVCEVGNTFPESRKYQPLDFLELTNNDAFDLTLTINGGSATFNVPAKTIKTISNQALWSVAITNLGGANTTLGKIIAVLQKQPLTIDQWARGRG